VQLKFAALIRAGLSDPITSPSPVGP